MSRMFTSRGYAEESRVCSDPAVLSAPQCRVTLYRLYLPVRPPPDILGHGEFNIISTTIFKYPNVHEFARHFDSASVGNGILPVISVSNLNRPQQKKTAYPKSCRLVL